MQFSAHRAAAAAAAGLALVCLLAEGLGSVRRSESPMRLPLASVAKAPPAIPVGAATVPARSLPILDAERVVWGDEADLISRRLLLPVSGITKATLSDSFFSPRGERGEKRHRAIDLGAPQGRPVVAVEDGVIRRIKWHERGGLTIYQYGPEGRFAYYYAHLRKLAKGLQEGCHVQRGEVIGYVGATGSASASAPHLHFEVRRLADREAWWSGDHINPYPALMAGEERDLAVSQLGD